MNCKIGSGILLGLAFALACPAADAASPSESLGAEKPNIVLLFIDDWAWNGSPIRMDDDRPNSQMPVAEMPHLKRLAREGMKFRNAYSGAPQCSPSRVCLQTGKSAARSGYTVFLGQTKDPYYDTRNQYQKLPLVPNVSDLSIDADAETIPEALRPLGYVSAHVGKWHMGGDPGEEGYVLHDGDTNNDPGNTIGKVARQPKDLTDPKLMFSTTERAIGFIEEQAKAGSPFYLQISHYAMHEGRECLNATREKYVQHPAVQAYYEKAGKTAETINRKQDPAIWLGMLEDLDDRIGAVLDKLEELGIEDNTYVIVVSDNGYRHSFFPRLTQPLHATKWWVWQGGIRVPMIVVGPDVKAGALFDANVVNYDFLPTFVEWAGGNPKDLEDIDGVSLAGYMRGEPADDAFKNRYLYFHYPHYRTTMPHSAIVSGTRKVMHFYERPEVPMLFDLDADEGEVKNIATQRPEEHQALYDEMMRYFEQVEARLPKVNPDYDSEFYQQTAEYEKRMTWGPFEGKRALDEDEK
jgi:arylsulfatase A